MSYLFTDESTSATPLACGIGAFLIAQRTKRWVAPGLGPMYGPAYGAGRGMRRRKPYGVRLTSPHHLQDAAFSPARRRYALAIGLFRCGFDQDRRFSSRLQRMRSTWKSIACDPPLPA